MIKVNKLRVNNLIKGVALGSEIKVDLDFFNELIDHENNGDSSMLDWYEGIKITTDKLLELGFTKGNYHTNWFSHVELNCHLVQFSDGEYVLEGVDDIRLSDAFRYIHQLQNLYFALAGEELEFKNVK